MNARRNLVIVRVGDQSLHGQWIAAPTRTFDLFLSYFGTTADRYREDADRYEQVKGPKWPRIAELLAEQPALLETYDAFWFPDDDLAVDGPTIDRMFDLFHGFGLALAQPALTRDSYWAHNTLLVRPEYILRRVGFVEVMAPLFDREALRLCLPTFAESRSGWGLDWVWPVLLERARPDGIAILDATPVRHTRQGKGGGELYKNNPEMDPRRDIEVVVARHGALRSRYEGKYRLSGVVRAQRPPLWERAWMFLRLLGGRVRYWRARRVTDARSAGTG